MVTKTEGTLHAYYNWGRWVADCWCDAGILVDKGGGLYGCRECRTFWQIVLPVEAAEVEGLCAKRPPKNRNWRPGEPVGGLVVENVEHGLASGWALKAAEK